MKEYFMIEESTIACNKANNNVLNVTLLFPFTTYQRSKTKSQCSLAWNSITNNFDRHSQFIMEEGNCLQQA
jgi:hypothetical protein